MSGQIGAEMGQLDALRKKFDQESVTVAQLTSSIGSQMGSTWWKGPAADRFRSEWESTFAPTLRQLEQALKEASAEISRRHQALTQAGS
jgi:WXG100 family type VII secretion target